MKSLHAFDWQMGVKAKSVGRMAEHVRDECLDGAKRAIQVTRTHGAELILLTGDLFEHNAGDRLLVRKTGKILPTFHGSASIIPSNFEPLTPVCALDHPV